MLNVAFVGDHGSGKATALGLLYATLVSSGSGKEDELRVHVAYDSLEEITGLFEELMSGAFPSAATKEGIHGLGLELEAGGLGRGVLSRFGSRRRAEGGANTVRVSLPGSLDETNPGLSHGSTFGTGRWRDALDADVVAVVVDGTRLGPKGSDPKAGPMAPYDGRVASFFVAVQRWRSGGGRPVLHPVFLFSKFDAVPEAVLKAAGLDASPPDVGKAGPRAAYAKALLGSNLPRTLALIEAPPGKKLRFGPPKFVFSAVRTEPGAPPSGGKIKRLRTGGGSWAPDYARDEYVAFLRWLAGVAAGAGD